MRHGNKLAQRVLSVVLAAVLFVVTTVPQPLAAWAATTGTKAYMVSLGASSVTGPEGNKTVSFPNATVTGDSGVTSVIVSVDKGYINMGAFDGIATMTDNQTNHQTVTAYWTSATGETVASIQTLLRNITYHYETGMHVTITLDGNVNLLPTGDKKITTYILQQPIENSTNIAGTIHYYMYVPAEGTGAKNCILWSDAYNTAKQWYFMGMQGYLVTVTEHDEDLILDKITDKGAWAGGTRLADSTVSAPGFAFDMDTADLYTFPSTTNGSQWYWIDGPEAGLNINNTGSFDSANNNPDKASVFGDTIVNGRCETKVTGAGQYSNWRRNPSDPAGLEPNDYDAEENRLQVHFPDAGSQNEDSDYGWNDLPERANDYCQIFGYFVEFSQYTSGGKAAGYSEDKCVTITSEVDHTHDWGASSNDTTDTITVFCKKTTVCDDSYTITVAATDATYTGSTYSTSNLTITDGISTQFPTKYEKRIEYKGTGDTTYTKSTTAPTNAGTYEVIVSLIDKTSGNVVKDASSNDVKVSTPFTINKKNITVTAGDQDVKVGSNIAEGSTKVSVTSGSLASDESITDATLYVGGTTGKTVTSTTQTGIVINTVTIKKSTTDTTANYNITTAAGTLNATKVGYGTVTAPSAGAITYGQKVSVSTIGTDGSVLDADGVIVDGTWTWESADGNLKPHVSDSGSTNYTLVFTPTNTAKYNTTTAEKKITVNPKAINVSWTGGDHTYDGVQYIPVPGTTDAVAGDEIVFGVAVKSGEIDIDTTTGPIEVGNYKATASITNADYTIASGSTKDYQITKRNITVKAKDQNVKVGSDVATGYAQVEVTSGSLVTDDNITDATIIVKGTTGRTVQNVSQDEIEVSEVVIKNGESTRTASYNVTFADGALVASKVGYTTQTPPSCGNITYGDTVSDSSIGTDGVVKDADGVTVPGTWTWETTDGALVPHVSDSGITTYTIEFTPDDTDKYEPFTKEVTITVNPKPIHVNWAGGDETYDGAKHIPTPSTTEALTGDSVDFAVTVKQGTTDIDTAAGPVNAGSYTATATSTHEDYVVITTDGADKKNYAITKRNVTVKASNQSVNVGSSIASEASKVSVSTGSLASDETIVTADLLVGGTTGKVVTSAAQNEIVVNAVTIKKDAVDTTANYNITYAPGVLSASQVTFNTITPPSCGAITYGETVGVSVIGNDGYVEDEDGVEVTGTWTWEDTDGNVKPHVSDSGVTTYTLVFTPDDTAKYPSFTEEVTITVNPKTITISWEGGDEVYDGEKYIPVPSADGAVNGDEIVLGVAVKQGATSIDTATGPVKVGSYTATATCEDGNYVIATEGSTKDYAITKKAISLKAPSGSAAYGGNIDNTTVTVAAGEFVSGDVLKNYTLTYDNETAGLGNVEITTGSIVIKNLDGDGEDVTACYEITTLPGVISVAKKIITIPDGQAPVVVITYGDDLGKDSTIGQLVTHNGPVYDGTIEVPGVWVWDYDEYADIDDKVPEVTEVGPYPVKFIPNDPNYAPIKKEINITIVPKDMSPENNPNVQVDISYDPDNNLVVVITDLDTNKKLTKDTDFTVTVDDDPDDEFSEIKIEYTGNYQGENTKIVKNQRYTGSVRSVIDIDEAGRKLLPEMEKVSEENAIALMLREIQTLAGVTAEDKAAAKQIIEDIGAAPDHLIEHGEYAAIVTLEIRDADATVPIADMTEVTNLMSTDKNLKDMKVGKFLDLSLIMQFTVSSIAEGVKTNLVEAKKYITESDFEETVTITVPTELRPAAGHQRSYAVVRVHHTLDGGTETEAIATTQNGYKLTFKTSKFSTYALLYKDSEIPKPQPQPQPQPSVQPAPKPAPLPEPVIAGKKVEAPKTGDTMLLFIAIGMIVTGILVLIGCSIVSKRFDRKYKRELQRIRKE